MRVLGVPPSLRVMPGGLRGGGAVHAYRHGAAISELMWKMRVRHQGTLEAYEGTAAASALTQLNANAAALRAIRSSSSFFDHLS